MLQTCDIQLNNRIVWLLSSQKNFKYRFAHLLLPQSSVNQNTYQNWLRSKTRHQTHVLKSEREPEELLGCRQYGSYLSRHVTFCHQNSCSAYSQLEAHQKVAPIWLFFSLFKPYRVSSFYYFYRWLYKHHTQKQSVKARSGGTGLDARPELK